MGPPHPRLYLCSPFLYGVFFGNLLQCSGRTALPSFSPHYCELHALQLSLISLLKTSAFLSRGLMDFRFLSRGLMDFRFLSCGRHGLPVPFPWPHGLPVLSPVRVRWPCLWFPRAALALI